MANFIQPVNLLEQAKTDKKFFVSAEGVIPKALGLLNKFLPLNVPLVNVYDLPVGLSALGTLVWDNIRFLPGIYTTPTNATGTPYSGLIVNTVVFEVRQNKNIVKDYVQGRDKSVKQYINAGDFDISIKGMITNEIFRNYYPVSDVQTFIELMKVPKPLTVQSKFLDMLGIKNILVESWSLAQTPGLRNVQAFLINAVDDIPGEINDITGE